ncbi:MAG TPA: ABC transporter permease [Pyrinomonadaceae bacterium]
MNLNLPIPKDEAESKPQVQRIRSQQTGRRRIWQPLWQLPGRWELILSLTKREMLARYRGSVLGLLWAFLTPLTMIAIFTLIFAGIFSARFGSNDSHWNYALYLFCGLLPWMMFQDTVQQAANTIVAHANLVKRVVFPLETLPVAQALAAIGNQLFGTIALVIAAVVIQRVVHPTLLLFPLLLIPQFLFTLGVAWLIASLGVFLRDIAQGITLLLMVWMYLTPIIYPESIVPERFQMLINLNPFTSLVRNYRRLFLEGLGPDWTGLAYFSIIAIVVFVFGYWWFARTRKNFADVI